MHNWADACTPDLDGAPPRLADGDVHVWRIATGPHLAAPDAALLSVDEQAHAGTLRHDADRRAYLLAHAAMRAVLSSYVPCTPRELAFRLGPFGKPVLVSAGSPPPLQFNLAHAGRFALLAVARARAVGIDVSRIDPAVNHAVIAEGSFSPREREWLKAVPPEEKRPAFHAAWSRKEAYVKATGYGLTRGLDHFDVSFAPGEPPALLADRLDPDAPSRWRLFDLHPGEGYCAALVVEAPVGTITLFDAPSAASFHAPQASV
ncbi:MAG TPA: 4'-phosphopantetheinyl transferase superfamily protein [Rhodothermales bacterium]|nr:4'-phosphopantetheinyl transferase superfamily protein [Rhodothermales bacterium]